jgi:hypothetical protein
MAELGMRQAQGGVGPGEGRSAFIGFFVRHDSARLEGKITCFGSLDWLGTNSSYLRPRTLDCALVKAQ